MIASYLFFTCKCYYVQITKQMKNRPSEFLSVIPESESWSRNDQSPKLILTAEEDPVSK